MKPWPQVLVVGAGPVATALAGALCQSGVSLVGLWGRTPQKVYRAAEQAGVTALPDIEALKKVLPEADCVVVAVRDSAIGLVGEQVLDTKKCKKTVVFLHCSGAMRAEKVFANIVKEVSGVGLLHPLRSIVDGAASIETIGGTTFGIAGEGSGKEMARTLCKALGGKEILLEGAQMPLYHAAAAMASNYIVTLMDCANRLLEASGANADLSSQALADLAIGTLENIKRMGTEGALSGPIRRGDLQTVEGHLAAIAASKASLLPLYKIIGQETLEIAARNESLKTVELAEIKKILEVTLETKKQ